MNAPSSAPVDERTADAMEDCRHRLAVDPHQPEILQRLGALLLARGQPAEALAALQQALALRPRFAEAQAGLGDVFRSLGQFQQAVAAYHNALSLRPGLVDARRNLGLSLLGLRDLPAATKVLRLALEAAPDQPETLEHLAIALSEQREFDEACALCQRALALAPDRADAHAAFGSVLQAAGRLDEAAASFRRGLDLLPGHYSAGNNLGTVLIAQNRLDEACTLLDGLRERHPLSAELRYNLGLAQLAAGDFAAGWENYEFRTVIGEGRAACQIEAPCWDGQAPIRGKSLFLHTEQGLGDMIHFVRYATLAAEAGAEVTLGAPAVLQPLFATVPGVRAVIIPGEPLPAVDWHCPLLSLPRAFGTRLDTIPARVPYLAAAPADIAAWRAALGSGRKVGFVWSGNPTYKNDRLRSIPLADFAVIARDQPHRFFSLQKDPRPADAAVLSALPRIEDLSARLGDFAHTAAIVSCLDLVVTVDTSAAHLAGALGVPVWVLLPFAADWRWLAGRTDSPWYPTMRLFRQTRPGDWASVLADVQRALAAFPSS